MPRGIMNKVDILARVLKLKHELGEVNMIIKTMNFVKGMIMRSIEYLI